MRSDVKILRRLKISEVVIRPENVRELAEIVYREYTEESAWDQNRGVTFILKGSDGTQYESENIEFLSEGRFLDTKRIAAIEMSYYNYSEYKRVSIDLSHATEASSMENEVIVSGTDEIWVNGILKSIENAVSDWQKQKNWPHKCRWLLAIGFSIGIALLLYSILDVVFSCINPAKARYTAVIVSLYTSPIFVLIMLRPSDRIRKLYPHVEFTSGPEHSHTEEVKRGRLRKIILTGAVPLALSAVFEFIKIVIKYL